VTIYVDFSSEDSGSPMSRDWGKNFKRGSTWGTVFIRSIFQSKKYRFIRIIIFSLLYILLLKFLQSSENKKNVVASIAMQKRQGSITLSDHATITVLSKYNESNVSTYVKRQETIQKSDLSKHECAGSQKIPQITQHNFIQSCQTENKETNTCLHFGTEYGGHEVPYPLCWLKPGDVYYGFGCGEDISFDISLADAYDLKVRLFDPTPKAIRHVDAVIRALDTRTNPKGYRGNERDKYYHEGIIQEISGGVNASAWFEKIIFSKVQSSQIDFHPWALADSDKNTTFFEPLKGMSQSLLEKHAGATQLSVVARELSSIMAELKDKKVHVMKIDIEGYEIVLIPVLVDLFRTWPIRNWPHLLLFDMDSLRPEHGNSNISEGQRCVQLIRDAGYEVFSSRNNDYTFVLQM